MQVESCERRRGNSLEPLAMLHMRNDWTAFVRFTLAQPTGPSFSAIPFLYRSHMLRLILFA